jgi:hypothetical protein
MSAKRKKSSNELRPANSLAAIGLAGPLPTAADLTTVFSEQKQRYINNPQVRAAHIALTSWLNGDYSSEGNSPDVRNTADSMQRILLILCELQFFLAKLEDQKGALYPEGAGGKPRNPGFKRVETYHARFPQLDKLLSDYAVVPQLVFEPKSARWGVVHQPALSSRPHGEVMAAFGLLELVRAGCLARVKRCDCGRWYFARKFDSVSCGQNRCRQRVYDQKPEVKERKKANREKNAAYVSGMVHVGGKNAKAKR